MSSCRWHAVKGCGPGGVHMLMKLLPRIASMCSPRSSSSEAPRKVWAGTIWRSIPCDDSILSVGGRAEATDRSLQIDRSCRRMVA